MGESIHAGMRVKIHRLSKAEETANSSRVRRDYCNVPITIGRATSSSLGVAVVGRGKP